MSETATKATPPTTEGAPKTEEVGTPGDPSSPAIGTEKTASSASGAPAAETGKEKPAGPTPEQRQAEFEKRLSDLSTIEMTVKDREKAVAALEVKYKALSPVGEALPDGVTPELLAEALGKLKAADVPGFLKAMLRDQWNADTLMKAADALDAEELTPEERVRREHQRIKDEEKATADKAAADAKAKEEDEKRARERTEAEEADAELKGRLTAAADFLRENVAKYPLIAALDEDDDVDHVALYTSTLYKLLQDPERKEVPTHEEIYTAIEERHRRMRDRFTPPPPTPPRHKLAELEANDKKGELPEVKSSHLTASRSTPKTGKTGAEEARERLRLLEAEDAGRAARSYR